MSAATARSGGSPAAARRLIALRWGLVMIASLPALIVARATLTGGPALEPYFTGVQGRLPLVHLTRLMGEVPAVVPMALVAAALALAGDQLLTAGAVRALAGTAAGVRPPLSRDMWRDVWRDARACFWSLSRLALMGAIAMAAGSGLIARIIGALRARGLREGWDGATQKVWLPLIAIALILLWNAAVGAWVLWARALAVIDGRRCARRAAWLALRALGRHPVSGLLTYMMVTLAALLGTAALLAAWLAAEPATGGGVGLWLIGWMAAMAAQAWVWHRMVRAACRRELSQRVDDLRRAPDEPFHLIRRAVDRAVETAWGAWEAWTTPAARMLVPALMVAAAAAAAAAPARAATTWHVRVDGSDTGCTGREDAAWPGSGRKQPCAFATPQRAADSLSRTAGDDIVIHAGKYTGRVVLPHDIQPRSGETIIEGDPNVPREKVWIDCDNAVDRECLLVPGGSGSGGQPPSTDVVVRHMRVSAGRCNAIRFEGFHERTTLQDVLFDDMPSLCCVLSNRTCMPEHIRPSVIRVDQGSGNIIEDFTILGAPNTTRYGLAGTDAMSIYLNSSRSVVQRGRSERMLGAFVQENGSRNIIQDNVVLTTTCEGDDGCIQVYNDSDVIVRRNVFADVAPDAGDWIVTMRMTNVGEGHGATASVAAYNNTLIGVEGWPDRARKSAFLIHPDRSAADYGPTVFLNNIFMRFGGPDARDAAIALFGCPASLLIDHNLFFGNASPGRGPAGGGGAARDFNNAAKCPGAFNAHSKFGEDPKLDPATFVPADGGPACAGGDTTFKAWDGDQARPWLGAKPCAGGAPGQPAP